MRRRTNWTVPLTLAAIVVLTAGIPEAWATDGLRAAARTMLAITAVAALLVMYFDWRADLRRRTVDERRPRAHFDRAA